MQQQQQSKQKAKMNNRPVHVVRFGAIKAAVWLNQFASGIPHRHPSLLC